jgi:hypothetical protein
VPLDGIVAEIEQLDRGGRGRITSGLRLLIFTNLNCKYWNE